MKSLKIFFLCASFALLVPLDGSAAQPCCGVTHISDNGQVTAAEVQGNRQLQFQVPNRSLLRSIRVGSPVYANFRTGEISLDGKTACCRILRTREVTAPTVSNPDSRPARTATPPAAKSVTAPAAEAPTPAPSSASTPALTSKAATEVVVLQNLALPTLSFGTPQNIAASDWRQGPQHLSRFQPAAVAQLQGNDGIVRAGGLPQSVKDVLWLHARTLEAHEQDSYIVIPELADAWARELPDEIRQTLRKAATDDGKKKKKGCSTKHISTGCLKNEVDQAVDDVTRAARKAWQDTIDEWGRLLNRAEEVAACFKEKRLATNAPLQFKISPSIGLSFEKDGKSSNKHGGASGKVTGSVNLGVPVRVQADVSLQMFYIPCLPFVVRPRSLGADGGLEVEGVIKARIDANGAFEQLFSVPPGGGVQIPVVVIPVTLAGVTIAVLDASIYLDGTLQIEGQGTLDGDVRLASTQRSRFSFECDGHSCKVANKGAPAPASAVESFQLEGHVQVKPAIYTALQLGLNYDMLNARAGPQPYLLGDIRGCVAGSAAQSTTGSSSSEAFHLLSADLDWGIELRAEALTAGKKVAKSNWISMRKHLLFQDLSKSSALSPSVTGMVQLAAGEPASFNIRMPSCYPYPEPVQYHVQWTGGASTSAAAPTSAAALRGTPLGRVSSSPPTSCVQQSSQQGTCEGTPSDDTQLYLAWPASGDYVLTVSPKEDKHGRKFDSGKSATRVTVRVD